VLTPAYIINIIRFVKIILLLEKTLDIGKPVSYNKDTVGGRPDDSDYWSGS